MQIQKNNLIKESIQKKIRFLKSLNTSLKFVTSSWEESRSIYQFDEAIETGNFFDGVINKRFITDYAPYPILVSSASGLSLISDNKVFDLLNTKTGFYVFGIAISEKRIFLSINFHFPIKSNINNLINKRITFIVSAKISDILMGIKGQLKTIKWEVNYSDRNKSYSYLNYYDGELFAADYLGTVDVFKFNKKGKFNLIKNNSYSLLKNKLHYPNFFYPFLHLNCVSIDKKFIYCGLHSYSKITTFKSSIYRIERNNTNNINLEEDTNFISAHDLMKVNNDFYGCDSANGKFYKNNQCIYKSSGKVFFRGLSINQNGFVLGSSKYFKRRSKREKVNINNKILFLDKDGKLTESITPELASIYRIFSLNHYELSQSYPIKIDLDKY